MKLKTDIKKKEEERDVIQEHFDRLSLSNTASAVEAKRVLKKKDQLREKRDDLNVEIQILEVKKELQLLTGKHTELTKSTEPTLLNKIAAAREPQRAGLRKQLKTLRLYITKLNKQIHKQKIVLKTKQLTHERTKLMRRRDRLTKKIAADKSRRVKRNDRRTRKHVRDEIASLSRRIREHEVQQQRPDLADAGTMLVRSFRHSEMKKKYGKISTYQVHYLLESDEIDRNNPILYNSTMSQSMLTHHGGAQQQRHYRGFSQNLFPRRDSSRNNRWRQNRFNPQNSSDAARRTKPRHGRPWSSSTSYGSWRTLGRQGHYPTIKRHPSSVSPYAHPLTSKNEEWKRIQQELETQMEKLFKEGTVLHIPNPLYPNNQKKQLMFTIRSMDRRPFPFKGEYQKYATFFKKSPFKFIIIPSEKGSRMIIVTTIHLKGRLQTAKEKAAERKRRITLKKTGKTQEQIDRIMGTTRRKSTLLTRLKKKLKCGYHLEELREIMRTSGLFPKPHLTKYQQMVERQTDETQIRHRSKKPDPPATLHPSAPPASLMSNSQWTPDQHAPAFKRQRTIRHNSPSQVPGWGPPPVPGRQSLFGNQVSSRKRKRGQGGGGRRRKRTRRKRHKRRGQRKGTR